MTNWLDNARATGRTTRMAEEAKRAAKAGKRVLVLAGNKTQVQRIRHLIGDDRLGIKVRMFSTCDFDWRRFEYIGMRDDVEILMDHHCIESRFQRLLREYHRYDPPYKITIIQEEAKP